MPGNKISWSENSKKQFTDALEYIMEDSVQSAENLQNKLLNKLEAVSKHPEMFPPDKYKTNNDGSFRVFVVFHYRVSYRIIRNEIRILRIRHSSMKPKYY